MSPAMRVIGLVGGIAALMLFMAFMLLGRGQAEADASTLDTALLVQPAAVAAKAKEKADAERLKRGIGDHGLPVALERALDAHGWVVVVIWHPEGKVDELSRDEARAGAAAAGAGFLAVDATNQRMASPLHLKLGVLHAPSVLIFRADQPDQPVFRTDGFLDRDAVEQAAANLAPEGTVKTKTAAPVDWAAQANAVCDRQLAKANALPSPETPAALLAALDAVVAIEAEQVKQLAAIALPADAAQRAKAQAFLKLEQAMAADDKAFVAAMRKSAGAKTADSLAAANKKKSQAHKAAALAAGATSCAKRAYEELG